MTPDELSHDRYQLLGEMTHATLADFVLEYFLRRNSWLTWLHHGLSLAALAAAITAAVMQERGVGRTFLDFGLSLAALPPAGNYAHIKLLVFQKRGR